jgi:hypothetical protein
LDPYRSAGQPAPVIFSEPPDAERLVRAINANTSEVRQLSCDVHIRTEGVPMLSGTLIVERPRKMRLKAGLAGISEMGFDVGSNDEEFWFWSKAAAGGQAPTIFHAKHSEFAASPARQSLPFEPQWVIDALGMLALPEDGSVQSAPRRADGMHELRLDVQTPAGPITRTYVADPKTGLVLQQSLYDANRRLIAYVSASHHHYFADSRASLPGRIELIVIGPEQQRTTVTMDLAGHEINQLYGDPEQQWTMPQPSDARSIDLARMATPGS